MLALVVGTLLAVAALAYVLYPLLFESAPRASRAMHGVRFVPNGDEDAVAALREIEFDRATGKLSDADYTDLKTRYTERALESMRAERARDESEVAAGAEDAVEAVVAAVRARLRVCARCGPRPEPGAVYCSNCGSYLDEKCAACGRAVVEAGASFCAGCGRQLAA